jgi:hypothetical protein
MWKSEYTRLKDKRGKAFEMQSFDDFDYYK